MSKEEMKTYERIDPGKYASKVNRWWEKQEVKFEYVVEVKK